MKQNFFEMRGLVMLFIIDLIIIIASILMGWLCLHIAHKEHAKLKSLQKPPSYLVIFCSMFSVICAIAFAFCIYLIQCRL